ncbi:hypothetical protein OHB49_43995 (plasmid) [Streptomyces sp. NBC_01717]|uniref:hypothetical protein n=1 Tax=Streptomyces sp. NBC_01717 TaxID=2975918 RepID=UPI002E33A005|nr:hypothetical protein [Streptomyces sp. NBC_01717]
MEADIRPSVAALQRIGPERLGPLLVHPGADRAWWLVPPGAEELLADLPRLTVHPEARSLLCLPADRYLDGLGWLEKPDGTGRLTNAATLGAAFGLGGSGLRLPAGAFC